MIFFSKEWAKGHLSEDLFNGILDLYHSNTETLERSGSDGLKKILNTSLNDYVVTGISENDGRTTVNMKFAENEICITYSKFRILGSLQEFVGKEILYDEIYFDEIEMLYVQNILFSDFSEISIGFEGIEIVVV